MRDGRVDLKKGPVPARLRIARQRPGPQADQTNTLEPIVVIQGVHHLSNRRGRVIVGQRLAPPERVEALLAMKDIAVEKLAIAVLVRHPMDAEETTLAVPRRTMDAVIKAAGKKKERETAAEAKRLVLQEVDKDERQAEQGCHADGSRLERE